MNRAGTTCPRRGVKAKRAEGMFPEASLGLAAPGAARWVPGGPRQLRSHFEEVPGGRGGPQRAQAQRKGLQKKRARAVGHSLPAAGAAGQRRAARGAPCRGRSDIAPRSRRAPRAPHLPSPPAALPSPPAPSPPPGLGEGRSGGPQGKQPFPPPPRALRWEKAASSAARPDGCLGSPALMLPRDTTSSVTPGHRAASGVTFRGLRLPGGHHFRGWNGKEQRGVFCEVGMC